MKKLLSCVSILAMAAMPAFAESNASFPTGLEFGLGVSGSSGLNGFVGYANKNLESFWWKRLGVRLDMASTTPVKSMINNMIDNYMGDGIEIGDHLNITDGKIESKHMALLVDFYPFGDTWFLGGWRLSAGYYVGDMNVKTMLTNKDDLSEFAGKRFQLGDRIWQYNGGDLHGTAKAEWDFSGPYLGTGFDIGLFGGFKIFMDAGVVFTSKTAELSLDVPATSQLQYSNDGGTSWTNIDLGDLTSLHNDIDETISDAQEKLDEYKFFPVVKVGFMYRF